MHGQVFCGVFMNVMQPGISKHGNADDSCKIPWPFICHGKRKVHRAKKSFWNIKYLLKRIILVEGKNGVKSVKVVKKTPCIYLTSTTYSLFSIFFFLEHFPWKKHISPALTVQMGKKGKEQENSNMKWEKNKRFIQ